MTTASRFAEKARQFMGKLRGKDSSGKALYSKQEIEDFVGLLVVTAKDAVEWTPAIQKVMLSFASRLQVAPQTTGPEFQQKLEMYFQKNASRRRIFLSFKTLIRDALLSGVEQEAISDFLKLVDRNQSKRPIERTPPSRGQVAGGPLARFQLSIPVATTQKG